MEKIIIPSKIRLLGKTWTIEIGKLSGMNGVTHLEDYKIILDKTNKNVERTLFHELSHAFLWQTGLANSDELQTRVLTLFIQELFSQIYPVEKNAKKLKNLR